MNSGIIVADAGPIFSLAVLQRLHLLTDLYSTVLIPTAVWQELTLDTNAICYLPIVEFFSAEHIKSISTVNTLTQFMDYGESEAVILYKEISADFLLIDDKKARTIAEKMQVRCVGTLGILAQARQQNLIAALRPLFLQLLGNKRYYSEKILNAVLTQFGEDTI